MLICFTTTQVLVGQHNPDDFDVNVVATESANSLTVLKPLVNGDIWVDSDATDYPNLQMEFIPMLGLK